MSVYDLHPQEYNKKLAEALKQLDEFKMPEWAQFVKTGSGKDRPPVEKDYWYKRAASILRQLYSKKVLGVNRLKTRYGNRKNRGKKPERFRKGSGKIIRTILQQAEKAGFVEKVDVNGRKKGRQLTQHGKKFLNDIGVGGEK